MSKPEDIPQDVWAAAEATLDRVRSNAGYAGAWVESIADVSRALMAEREACALIADGYAKLSDLHNYGSGISRVEEAEMRTARFISEDIRKRGESL